MGQGKRAKFALLNLPLLEDTVVVSETITPSGVVERGQRVHITSGQASETTVTKSSVDLRLDHILHVETKLFNTLY